jgi:hypothetical protein
LLIAAWAIFQLSNCCLHCWWQGCKLWPSDLFIYLFIYLLIIYIIYSFIFNGEEVSKFAKFFLWYVQNSKKTCNLSNWNNFHLRHWTTIHVCVNILQWHPPHPTPPHPVCVCVSKMRIKIQDLRMLFVQCNKGTAV